MNRLNTSWLALLAAGLSASSLSVGCSRVSELSGKANKGGSPEESTGPSSLVATPRTPQATTSWLSVVNDRVIGGRIQAPANRLCGLDSGRVLACAMVPMARVEASFCPATEGARDPQRCQPSQLATVDETQRIGWILTAPENRPRVLSILRGTEVLVEAFRVPDASSGVLEVAVCPMDVDADGINEVAVVHRSIAAPDTIIVDLATFKPQERHSGPESARSPLAYGEGCASLALASLVLNRSTGALGLTPVLVNPSTTAPGSTKA